MEETRMTAALPNLDVEIVHRDLPEEGAEMISISLKATPGFAAVADGFGPLLPGMALWLGPMQAWASLAQRAWAPWLSVMGAVPRIGAK